MYRLSFLLVGLLLLTGCNKDDENIIWEKSFGQGRALFVRTTGDSGYVACGESAGKQYLVYIGAEKNKVMEYKAETRGIITAAVPRADVFVAAGSSGGKLWLAGIDGAGTIVWDTLFNASFRVDYTSLVSLGSGQLLALGSADPDSARAVTSGLSFVFFSSSGTVNSKRDITFPSYTASKSIDIDEGGNFYLALTGVSPGGKLKASVAKYNSDLQKLWEKDLYNNPSFGAASLDITLDENGYPVVTGRTQLQVSSGIEENAFVARYMQADDSLTKRYLEYANAGSAIIPDGTGKHLVLNMNCLIINIIDQDVEVAGIIRTYSLCDSRNTDAFGHSMDLTPDGNIIIAGTKGGGFYLAVKSSTALSPV